MENLDDYLEKATHLPATPTILINLMALLRKVDTDIDEIVELISMDPSITAGVIQLCNSAMFGGSGNISDIEGAVGRLGFDETYRIVASVIGRIVLAGSNSDSCVQSDAMWRHSAAVGVASQIIAKNIGQDSGQAFTAGLLHDIGKIVLADALNEEYSQMIEECRVRQTSHWATEKEKLGVDHAAIGGPLLEKWKFSDTLISAVKHHHEPLNAGADHPMVSIVFAGDLVAHFIGYSLNEHAVGLGGVPRYSAPSV